LVAERHGEVDENSKPEAALTGIRDLYSLAVLQARAPSGKRYLAGF
jgi:hypothetical protein